MPFAIEVPVHIPIIGMACRFPRGANSPKELWRMLDDGRLGWSEIPADCYTWRSLHHPNPDVEAAQVISTPGGMLVTSLSEVDAYKYIERVGKRRLSLACINCPSSITISGDKDAHEERKTILKGESIMAKLLAVDVAYHLYHMKAVADQYLNSLRDLESSEARDDIQLFSSMTSELKTSGFGAEYWV